ncbi:MAG: Primosomal protein N' [Candidatus Peregrinibacteria bacterium GW2011_GWA2_47_7]|nr:MAG: Primosomal protein N' [Candidatus Peregrinibacteria bacterium GW2011_GWA2_47_7]
MLYAEIVINRKLPGNLDTLTYKLQKPLSAGHAVWVPFRSGTAAGIIIETVTQKPTYKTRETLDLIFDNPLLKTWQITLARWLADYYLCPLSKIIPLFIPQKMWMGKKVLKRKNTKDEEASLSPNTEHLSHTKILTADQKNIIGTILKNSGKRFLLHGVTGSGKTEIYLRLAQAQIESGKQVLILVPEIALTPQIIDYFQRHFNQPISVIHSKLSEGERNREWLRVYLGESSIVIGSRSAIFAPFQDLGLIVVDEEHEWTYKQSEQSPRYHARTVVEKISELTGCTVVLGSATPNVETYHTQPPHTLLSIPDRIGHERRGMPKTTIVDLRDEIHQGNFSMISVLLREKLAETLAMKKQAILFINRRGIASATLCRDCGFVVHCEQCRIAMVLHKLSAIESQYAMRTHLVCHHCGLLAETPTTCPNCKSARIRHYGVGTQRVEEEIAKLFGHARIVRADRDTTSKKHGFRKIYDAFKNHTADILIGTQIIGKGLDIPNVHLVGVILADTSLHFPDFRASERTFQLLTQVSGRAGRGMEQGEVIIQTYSPDHYAIQAAADHDYETFFNKEIKIRESLSYPPFSKIIKMHYADKDETKCKNEALKMEKILIEIAQRDGHSDTAIHATPGIILRLHGTYHWEIFIKGKKPLELLKAIGPLSADWKVDVDPS